MRDVGLFLFVSGLLSAAWYITVLRSKLRRYQSDELLTKIKSDAKDSVHEKTLSDLVDDTNKRRGGQ